MEQFSRSQDEPTIETVDTMTVLRSGSASDVGRVRAVNEDMAFPRAPSTGWPTGWAATWVGMWRARIAVDALQVGVSGTADS